MQQGLRACVQDENAMAALHRPLKGTVGLGVGDGGNFAGKGASSMPPTRKALGNITNSKAGFGAEGALPGKTPAGAPSVRRALGDITNSNAVPSAQKAAQKAPLTIKPVPAVQQRQPLASVAVTAESSRLDVLAEGGVERMAGHGWERLEAGRLAREDAEAQARLAALANFSSRGLPNFFPSWGAVSRGSVSQQRVLQKDVLLTPLASPVTKRHTGQGAGRSNLPLDFSLPLPDITLPGFEEEELDLAGLEY